MIPFKAIDCPEMSEINQDLLEYLSCHTSLLKKNPDWYYCNFVDTLHFIKNNPKLLKWFNEKKLRPLDIYFTLCWDYPYNETDREDPDFPGYKWRRAQSPCAIHLDKPPVVWKMNWPVLNMEHSAVRFFRLKDPSFDPKQLVVRKGKAESKDRDHYCLPYEPFEETHRYRFSDKPIIMNGQIPHDVFMYEHVWPRIGLQIMFMNEPLHLLSPENF